MKDGEDGYILASAIGVLLAISIVAAALVASSADALTRVRRAELEAKQQTVLQSAFTLVSAQLVLDPRRRQMMLDDVSRIDVFGSRIDVKLAWEIGKLDVNLADPRAIETMLADQRMRQGVRDEVLTAVRASRLSKVPVRLLSDLGVGQAQESCLSAVLTVFGGRSDYDREAFREKLPIGGPAPGSRLSIDLTIVDEPRGLAAVVLVTGDPLAPVKLLDWRETNGSREEDCDEV